MGGFVACGRRRPLATPQRTQSSVKACEPLQSGDASRLVLGMFYFTTALSTIARTACGAECYATSSKNYLQK